MEKIQEIIIYCFSGTGNSRQIAGWFSRLALDKVIPCRISDIAKTGSGIPEKTGAGTLIMIISPIHGFNYPKITLDFIRRFPAGKNRVILMNTRAGLKAGKIVTPGLTGIAFIVSSLLLKKKGYKIAGQIAFDMPSNWISIHPALKDKSVGFILEKNHARVKKHFEELYMTGSNFSARKDIIQDILISPVSLAYYMIGRFFLGKSYYASDKCTNCNLCIKQCPVQAIRKVDGRPYWTFKCESCMRCMNNCPENAIETTHGLWVILIYITSIICTYLFYDLLPGSFQYRIVKFLLFNILLIGLLWIGYRIQQFALKNRVMARLISFTSLTHYSFWGRYRCRKS